SCSSMNLGTDGIVKMMLLMRVAIVTVPSRRLRPSYTQRETPPIRSGISHQAHELRGNHCVGENGICDALPQGFACDDIAAKMNATPDTRFARFPGVGDQCFGIGWKIVSEDGCQRH